MFQIKHYMLPHDGIMPGARGYKKVVVPKGTKVYCVVYGTKIYWCTYLHEADAIRVKEQLEQSKIEFEALIAWNFKYQIPKRVYRSEEYRK